MPISIKARIEKSVLLGMSQDFKAARGEGEGVCLLRFLELEVFRWGERTGWFEIGAHVQLDLMMAFSTLLALTMHLVANIVSVGSQITDTLFGECYCNSWLRRDWPEIRLMIKSKSL